MNDLRASTGIPRTAALDTDSALGVTETLFLVTICDQAWTWVWRDPAELHAEGTCRQKPCRTQTDHQRGALGACSRGYSLLADVCRAGSVSLQGRCGHAAGQDEE
jgi:hypothetical protein